MKNFILTFFFLLASSSLDGFLSTILRIRYLEVKEEFSKSPLLRFLDTYLKYLFKNKQWDGLLYIIGFSKHVLQLCYALSGFSLLTNTLLLSPNTTSVFFSTAIPIWFWLVVIALVIISISLFFSTLTNLLCTKYPKCFLKTFCVFPVFSILICSPLTLLFFKILNIPFLKVQKSHVEIPGFRIKDKILDILHDSELSPYLDQNDQKLILSVASFKDRIAREVMVPRIDIFSLSADTSIEKAAHLVLHEGYSRVPVYKENIDHIIGVLLYKDVLRVYTKEVEKLNTQKLQGSIEPLLKPILYTPETKKISYLLQEFRSKQIHLAIVVDEYGGTEGIVTIEDILEELVGEIADEYDVDEENLFTILPTGGWIVDAKMTIVDIEEELGIKVPQAADYDTIGGYVFHRSGSIPSKGWRIHHDDFDLEVLSSDERSIEKIRITPNTTSN